MLYVLADTSFHNAAILADHIDEHEGWDCLEVRSVRKTDCRQLLVKCVKSGDKSELQSELETMVADILGPKDK